MPGQNERESNMIPEEEHQAGKVYSRCPGVEWTWLGWGVSKRQVEKQGKKAGGGARGVVLVLKTSVRSLTCIFSMMLPWEILSLHYLCECCFNHLRAYEWKTRHFSWEHCKDKVYRKVRAVKNGLNCEGFCNSLSSVGLLGSQHHWDLLWSLWHGFLRGGDNTGILVLSFYPFWKSLMRSETPIKLPGSQCHS